MLAISEACERNKDAILEVLRAAFATRRKVLEIGSGTGQHAVYFSAALTHLEWQPTERPAALGDLEERVAVQGSPNLRSPLVLDVSEERWPVGRPDAAFTANTLHIMSWREVNCLFRGLAEALEPEAVVGIYGPFSYDGRHTSTSNERFDAMLRERDPASGVRDMREVIALAGRHGLGLLADHALPANNRLIVLGFSGSQLRGVHGGADPSVHSVGPASGEGMASPSS